MVTLGSGARGRHWLLALTLVAGAGLAHAGLFDDEEARRAILDLRQRIDVLKQESEQKLAEETKRSSEESAQLRRAMLDLQNQLEAIRAEMAKLRGQSEQLARDVAEIQRLQKDAGQSLEERLRKLEPVRVSVDGREFLVEPAEKREFETALAVFRKGDFAAAQTSFVDFLSRYSATGYRPSALFWLGNAQYATKDYKEAQANFRVLVQQSPDHMRVPEALLAIANCQLEVKDVKAARKTLDEVLAKHPGTEAAAAAKERLARLK
ncbi:MAG: tol-pal system protein YbgF [Curvibacter sp. RIFCSPHIGHO2_12_FULL_63_18]|uniref:tol-pal system protein YbgF n=1 Tax=Rhodoferax sp. TaxID=50421 RepID=UPI0008B9320F|nr:tol-pal system protein YbgF [Rhodoferax sp.]OGO96949.1 MAG: tol-pal system protein YbgF [Curvibacter sp. GWA2_63_95]OGP01125.1 MAG: tol-pal system protein YbgF [Curvibacter sp. RIFCSPHIGHO2_12_FULL_63_18]HCX80713.1 tol-pal system protein YbgF [Rhodoferax sp.]